MVNEIPWLNDELKRLAELGLVRRQRRVTPLANGYCRLEGATLKNFASNDYLNLAQDPRLVEAARSAASEYGIGSGASALITGRTDWHERLEQRLARFEQQESAILFPTGFAANVGTIAALVDSKGAVFSDRLNHASLIDGCRLSGAKIHIYEHADLNQLDDALRRSDASCRRLIVTDSVFSMDGDFAPLDDLCDLAEHYGVPLLVDEAHATGVIGDNGRGVAELMGVEHRIAVKVGTLSKGLGALGGFVSGPLALTEWLWNRARTQFFSTALPPALCAAACAAVDIVEQEPWRRKQLLEVARLFRENLINADIETCPSGGSAIVPVVLKDSELALSVAEQLKERGFLVAGIRPPSVPQGTSRLRVTFSAAHTPTDQADLLAAIVEFLRG